MIKEYAVWLRDRARPVWSCVTPAGRAVLAVAAVAWLLAARFGWQELAIVAASGMLLLLVAGVFLIGRTRIAVRLVVEPPRVTVGEPVSGAVEVENRSRAPMLPLRLELPVGAGGVAFQLPVLAPAKHHQELFVVPTERRGVIEVGPVRSVRGDPVGLLRREVLWSQVHEIFVHPRIVPLEPLGAGLMRDLEGTTSENVSMSDLAFHALREYSPGDDLRHVHWRSSARHGQLLVRQFLDTRRSHLTVVVDSRPDAYTSDDDYELAISVAGSLLVRALLDDFDATFASGAHASSGVLGSGVGKGVLDGCARAEPSDHDLVRVARDAARLAPDTSVVFLVGGAFTQFIELQRADHQFPPEVAGVAVRVEGGAAAGLRAAGDLPLLTLGRLEDLPALMRWGR